MTGTFLVFVLGLDGRPEMEDIPRNVLFLFAMTLYITVMPFSFLGYGWEVTENWALGRMGRESGYCLLYLLYFSVYT